MKDYARIIGKITSAPWLMELSALNMLLEIFEAHLNGTLKTDDIQARMAVVEKRQSGDTGRREGKIGVLGITGPIFPKANLMTELSGATSVQQFREDFRAMMGDDSVDAILLDVDSPGGFSDQIDEMATEIREARDKKPVYSIANTAANSAAYYLAAQAFKMFATPSGQLGSVGTYMVHEDKSRQREAQGVDQTIIKAGRFKAVTEETLTGEGRKYLQDHVDATNDMFVKSVAEGRGVSEDHVRSKFGEGGIVVPAYALDNKMIDGIKTFDQVVETIGSELGGGQLGIAARGGLKQSYDADKEHSEPGTGLGGEPTPREPPEEGDPAIEGGWRRDPPPIVEELEEEEMDRQWLEARATALGIEFDSNTSDEDLGNEVATRVDEIVVPLQQATAEAQKAQDFAKDYPEHAAKIARLENADRENAAKTFASQYARFEGSSKGYSTLVRDLIEDAHMKIAMGQFTQDEFKALLDATANRETSVVDWAEDGSARLGNTERVMPTRDFTADRQKFADLVSAAMKEDNLDMKAAMAHVSELHPELAQAYLTGHAR